ncbi:cytoskeleton-associated protein 2 [Chanos chanos]|uniref:Cytoskeleton-associated protein 2 n=1 Tax=Chanos chanos TaxID=29144 RepID=A0A6J2WXH4_CHACN|nr:cytoskeleton-associated protein 2-like [Chanos chanos]
MDTISKKSNKENTKPATGARNHVSSVVNKQKVVGKTGALRAKNDLKEKNLGGTEDTIPVKGELTAVRPASKPSAVDLKKRHTLSQQFRSQQSVRHQKLVMEVVKPTSAVPPKTLPGTYKGRVVQSKVDCFRKPGDGEKEVQKKAAVKPNVPKPPSQKLGTLSKMRSKSVTSVSGPAQHKPYPRPKAASDAQLHIPDKSVQKPITQRLRGPKVPATTRPAAALRSAPPSSRPAPAPMPRPVSSKSTTVVKGKEPLLSTKSKAPVAASERRVQKPVTSTLSQYRVSMETAEERRAKLAEWLATKGRTLKRPPIAVTLAPQTRQPEVQPKIHPEPKCLQPQPPVESEAENPNPQTKADIQTENAQVPEHEPAHSPSHIMNTTLDLMDNSDLDLPVDPEVRMEGLVRNLCDALEAMETPSACRSDPETSEDDGNVVLEDSFHMPVKMEEQVKEEETTKEFEILTEEELEGKSDSESDASDDRDVAIKSEDESLKKEDQKSDENEPESDEDELNITPPETEGASMVKYSIKTTPFLQSVKKRIEDEVAPASGSRRKSAIKDLKFLTPVRRSCRIQRKSSRLPGMLNDHDPCVSSLAELVHLDDSANAYIYRKNPALLDELPDHAGALERL